MDAHLDRRMPGRPVAVVSLLGAYLCLWLVLVVLLGALVYSGQLRQAREEFDARVTTLHGEINTRLKANEIILDGMAAFLRVSGGNDGPALRAYAQQVLARFPQIHHVVLQHGAVSRPNRLTLAAGAAGFLPAGPEAEPLLQETALQALHRGRASASGMFRLYDQLSGYALYRPIYSREDTRYESALVSVLVRMDELLPQRAPLAADLDVTLQHGRFATEPETWTVTRTEPVSASAALLFPRLRAVRVFGTEAQPFVLTVERQLGWSVVDPLVATAFALAAALGLFAAFGYGRSHVRREAERRRSELKLYRLANFDSLTGLPNRNLFDDRLQQALSRARRHDTGVALYFLDLDGFKAVNDSGGHASGDRLLQMVAERLNTVVREQDTVARLSGDEFVVLLEGIRGRDDAERVMGQLHGCFVESFEIGSHEFMVTASIGLAVFPEDGQQGEALLQRADQKMYASKHPEWAAG